MPVRFFTRNNDLARTDAVTFLLKRITQILGLKLDHAGSSALSKP